jgi:hypothetical protein
MAGYVSGYVVQAQYDLWQAGKLKQPKIQPLLKQAA